MKATELRKLIREEVRRALTEIQVKKGQEYECTHPSIPKAFKKVFTQGIIPDQKEAMRVINFHDTWDIDGNDVVKKRNPAGQKAALDWFKKYNSPTSKGPFVDATPIAPGWKEYQSDDWPKLIDSSYIKEIPGKKYSN